MWWSPASSLPISGGQSRLPYLSQQYVSRGPGLQESLSFYPHTQTGESLCGEETTYNESIPLGISNPNTLVPTDCHTNINIQLNSPQSSDQACHSTLDFVLKDCSTFQFTIIHLFSLHLFSAAASPIVVFTFKIVSIL